MRPTIRARVREVWLQRGLTPLECALSAFDKDGAMTAFLFLQRFENGQPATMPFGEVTAILGRHGKTGRGRGDLEVTFESDTTAAGCTVAGDARNGVICVGFERPRYDSALRNTVWECMQALQCAAFNDTLDTIYVPSGGASALPASWHGAAPGPVRQITSAQQLWTDELESATEARVLPAARYPNPNPNGPNFLMFDGTETAQGLVIEIGMRPEACNPGTLRVLHNLEARVDAAIRTNREFAPFYRFTHNETSMLFLESPAVIKDRVPSTIITSLERLTKTGFVADRGLFALTSRAGASCIELARQEFRVELDDSLESIDALSKVLDAVHARDRAQRQVQSAWADPDGKTTMRWALLAGAYLGTIVQRHIGGQWGYRTRPASRRQPALLMHNGRIRHPHLQVLDHLINGRSADVAAWVRSIASSDRSPTPRDQDTAGSIPQFCEILLGTARFAHRGLPLEAQIPRAALDFSVASLNELDGFITRVAAQAEKLPSQGMYDIALVVGAYLGEVIRSNAADGEHWSWVNYDDYAQAHPEFRKQRPREFGFLGFLDSAHNTAYPCAHVAALLAGASLPTMHAYACQLIGGDAAAGSGATAGAAPGSVSAGPAAAPHAAAEDATMKQALVNVREALAKWRRLATPTDFLAVRGAGPGWVRGHALEENVAQQVLLLQKGDVVWGALLQANNALFKPGPDDLPGAILYSRDAYFDARPQALRAIARTLFGYKGADAPQSVRPITEWLANEREMAFNLPVPPDLTTHPAFATGMLFFRKHLPEQVLAGAWMPLLTHTETRAVMVAPRQFWPRELVARWKARDLETAS
jgi:hypothetical protein